MKRFYIIFVHIICVATGMYYADNFDDSWEKHWMFGNYHKREFYESIKKFGNIHGDDESDFVRRIFAAYSKSSEAVQFYEFHRNFQPFVLEGNFLTIQFTVSYENIFTCSGGYVELLGCPYNSIIKNQNEQDKSQYNFLFGLDICESNIGHLHFVLNGAKLKYEKNQAKFNNTTHIYTLYIEKNYFVIMIDGDIKVTNRLADLVSPKNSPDRKNGANAKVLRKLCAAKVNIWQVKSGTIFDNIIITDDKEYNEQVISFLKNPDRIINERRDNDHPLKSTHQLDLEITGENNKTNKIFKSVDEALADVKNGSSLMIGGFGICGIPENLIIGLMKKKIGNLTVISSHAGIDHFGLGLLLEQHKIRKIIASAIGRNAEFQRQYLSGELEVELTPQGSLAEKIRAAGAGIPAFFTPTGYGTLVQGNMPVKYTKSGEVEKFSEAKRTEYFDGSPYILERSLFADFALIKAWKADTVGNLVFHESARNFNTIMATAGKITIVEAEHIFNAGDINPNEIHTPGIYVDRIIQGQSYEKRIEKIVTMNGDKDDWKQKINPNVERIIKRAVLEFEDGMYGAKANVYKRCNGGKFIGTEVGVEGFKIDLADLAADIEYEGANLGIGIPQLASNYIPKNITVFIHSENGILGLGPYPNIFQVDPDLINAGKEAITVIPGSSYFDSSESFAMVRGGHIDMTMLGALEVSKFGDLANWMIPEKLVKGMGGAMDLVSAPNMRTVVLMEHNSEDGSPKILDKCNFPLTGRKCVDLIITEKGVFSVDKLTGLTLIEIADDQTVEDIKSNTGCNFVISHELQRMKQLNVI